ncbi:MAG: hypothetical protein QMC80_00880 [Thermoplasmatales archaeon]|nr:hypothetical protein [Thermoplasmatales archaeon]
MGGLASILYGAPRTTADIDITIMPTRNNVKKTIIVLKELGLNPEIENITEILGVGRTSFENDWKIDMLVDMKPKDFNYAWKNKTIIKFKGVELCVIPRKMHIDILKKLGRAQDIDDLKYLEE